MNKYDIIGEARFLCVSLVFFFLRIVIIEIIEIQFVVTSSKRRQCKRFWIDWLDLEILIFYVYVEPHTHTHCQCLLSTNGTIKTTKSMFLPSWSYP